MDPRSFMGSKTPTVSSNLKKDFSSKLRGNYPCLWCSKMFHYKSIRDAHTSRCHSDSFSMASSKGKTREFVSNIRHKKRSILISKERKTDPKTVLQSKNQQPLPNFSSFFSASSQECSSVNRSLNTRQNTEVPVQTHFFQCSLCNYKTDHKLTFDRHLLKHTIGDFVCDRCQMPFLQKENLFTHIELKHSKTDITPSSNPVWHRCPHCPYKTSFKSVINRHIFKHNLASHACEICQMPFINKANIFHHMKLKHPRENKATTNKMESNLHKCPFCPYTSSAYNQISRHMTIRHYQEERYECKVCELFLPSQMALAEHNTLTHLNTNNFDMSLKSSIESTATHLYCPVCQNRLDVRSLLTDAGDHTCPTCNMVFSLELLMEKNFIPNFTPDESFNNFPSSSNRRQHLFEVQQVEEIYSESLNFPNDNTARFKDFGNPANDLNQAIQKGHIDFIEINDDDDDDDDVMRIDVDATGKLGYPLRCTTNAADKDPNPNSCLEKPRVPDRTNDLLTVSLNETFSNPGQPTSITHSNSSVSKRGRYVKLVSDFDDFEERPFACALCYQRYAQFPELSVHVQNHLTGAGRSGGDQSVDYFTW